ncbi:MAG: hypothetical protein ACO3JL_19310, partial [Myxococcota bacterium]
FYRANQLYFLTAPSLPDGTSIHDQVLVQGRLRVMEAGGREVPCARSESGDVVRCKSSLSSAAMQVTRLRVDKAFSRCIDLSLPPPGAQVELTLEAPLAPRVSGLRLGVPDGQRTTAGIGVEIIVDGEAVATTRLAEGRKGSRWLQFRSPMESLVVRAHRQAPESAPQVCLLFGDEEWRSVDAPEELSEAGLERRY